MILKTLFLSLPVAGFACGTPIAPASSNAYIAADLRPTMPIFEGALASLFAVVPRASTQALIILAKTGHGGKGNAGKDSTGRHDKSDVGKDKEDKDKNYDREDKGGHNL